VRDDEILACYVGTIGMAHGLGTVLQAAAILRRTAPEVTVLIVGDGAELESLRAAANREAQRIFGRRRANRERSRIRLRSAPGGH